MGWPFPDRVQKVQILLFLQITPTPLHSALVTPDGDGGEQESSRSAPSAPLEAHGGPVSASASRPPALLGDDIRSL